MNIRELDMIKVMKDNKIDDQRMLADRLDISLGAVNKSINELKKDGYITENYELTDQSLGLFKEVKSAIILAAG
ncbi:winged helix-turn-helix domain-containing protein, partial [Sharpea azabuensis]